MEVLFLATGPTPYRLLFWHELSKYCNLTVVYEIDHSKERDESWISSGKHGFNEIYLDSLYRGRNRTFCPSVIKHLNDNRFDLIIVGGYSTPTGMFAIQYMKIKSLPFVISIDGGLIKNDNWLKHKIKQQFISGAMAWLSTGAETDKYLVYYGAEINGIYRYPFTPLMKKDLLEQILSKDKKIIIKNDLGINEDKVILSVGQFINRKGFDILLKSCTKLPKKYGIYIVGGEPTQEYIDLKNKLEVNNVHFVGFKSKEELRKYYMASDLFVLPTREDIWGLVVNEAMAYGVPVITTDKCIAGLELVKDYENGFIVPVDDEDQLSEKINIILSDDSLCRSMSEKSLEKIREYTIEKMAERHLEIFENIISDYYTKEL